MRHNLLQGQLQLRELEIKICLLNDRFEGKTVVLNGIDTLACTSSLQFYLVYGITSSSSLIYQSVLTFEGLLCYMYAILQ